MFDAYVIEIRDAAAGIIVRDGNRFRFCASDRQFYDLEGRSFCSPRDAEAAALRHVLNRETRKAGGSRML
jgi:hypothetical protein